MDAISYLKGARKMCDSIGGRCVDCPIHPCTIESMNDQKMYVDIVADWIAKNASTRQSNFLKMFPDAAIDEYDGVLDIYPCRICKTMEKQCDELADCDTCRKSYWLAYVCEDLGNE